MHMHADGHEAVLYHVHVILVRYIINIPDIITLVIINLILLYTYDLIMIMSYTICITACIGFKLMHNQDSYHAIASVSARRQRPAEFLFVDGDQWDPRAFASQVITQLACNMHHQTMHSMCSTAGQTVRVHARTT